MTIRVRLVIMCLVVALLPAVPLSYLVKTLIEKSFNIGLSETMEGALQSGLTVSRAHWQELRASFEKDAVEVAQYVGGATIDSARVADALTRPYSGARYWNWPGAMGSTAVSILWTGRSGGSAADPRENPSIWGLGCDSRTGAT